MMTAGIDPEEIATATGYKNAETIKTIYWEELNRRRDTAQDDALAIQLDRLEKIFQGQYPKARKGSAPHARSAIKVLEAEAKLRGINYADGLEERRVVLAEDSVDLATTAMRTALDAIGLTPEQEAIKESVIKEQVAILTGMAFVSLQALVADQDAKNDQIVRDLAMAVDGEDEDDD